MNNELLVIEHASSNISAQLNCPKLEYNNQSKDEDIHRWLITNEKILSNALKLIIPVRLGNEDADHMGLYIGMHIRLTKELGKSRFLPLLFLSEDSKEEILSNQINNYKVKSALLVFTKGAYLLSAFALDEYITKPILPIDEKTLIEIVIPTLNIENTKDSGHQLANEWGAFRLAKFAGYSIPLEKPASLFFKYKDNFTNNEIVPVANNTIGLFNESCKALLIDDNTHSGWREIIKYILRSKIVNPQKLVSLDVLTTFEEANNYSDYLHFDVVFLDLRLLKEEERTKYINSIDDFTGTKILKRIIEINPGIQVIMFTASNKVWNIEKLLEIGATGYYIKESPEYALSTRFSKDNYEGLIKTIQSCLTRKPLKQIYSDSKNIKSIITALVKNKKINKNFGNSLFQYIDLANKLINSAKSDNDYAMGYLLLFKCIEIINEEFIIQDSNGNWNITIFGPLKHYTYNNGSGNYTEIAPTNFRNNLPTTFERITGLCFQKLGFSTNDIQQIYYNILRRNNFIHPSDENGLTTNQKSEIKKIYSYAGYLSLLSSINKILMELSKKL